MSDNLTFRSNIKVTADEFVDLLKRSTLDARRPVNDPVRIQKMLDNANLMVTAWAGDKLVGVSRALTDYSFCCYLSDLAVDQAWQKQGVGKALIRHTHEAAGPDTMLILLAAPAAVNYYPKIKMTAFPHCFIINRKENS